MASGYPGREYLLKRTLPEQQQQQQQQSQQLQQALFLRSVKHKAVPLQTSPISPLDLSHASSTMVGFSFPPLGVMEVPELEPEPESEKKTVIIKNRLQELERQLLLDDDEDEESAITNNEWNDTIQQLISPLSPSPTSSSSSSSSSTASSAASSTSSSRQLLLDTANAISDGNLDTAAANLSQLKQAANLRGDPDQRLTAIMVSALVSRLNPSPSASHPFADLGSAEHLAGTAMLHEVSPVFKLSLLAANLAILDATRDHLKIHIIDFDVGQGVQYATFIHALAGHHRHNHSSRLPAIKITAVADPSLPFHASHLKNNNSNLRQVGERLARLAEQAGVGLRFNIVCRRPSELDRSTLGCEPGEALAVNFAFLLSRVADESVTPANPRDELLRRVKALSPLIVLLVEQDMNTNTAPFAPRFAEVCAHYGALLDSLHTNRALDLSNRTLVEACIVRKATNAVARDGADRIERCEVFGKWRARMGMAGFTPSPLTSSVSDSVQARLGSTRPNPGFTLKEDAGGLCLGWHGRNLTVVSAWR